MATKHDIEIYKNRWQVIARIQEQENRLSTPQLAWQQLNSAHGLGKALGLSMWDPSEMGVFMRWKKIKDHYEKQQWKT